MSANTYKLRRVSTGKDKQYESTAIAVPPQIAAILPEDIRFTAELTDEGILYRPTEAGAVTETIEAPAWAKGFSGKGAKAPKPTPAKGS